MDKKEESLLSAPEEEKKNKIHPSPTPPSISFSPEAPIQLKKRDGSGLWDAYALSSEGSLLLLLIITIINNDGHFWGPGLRASRTQLQGAKPSHFTNENTEALSGEETWWRAQGQ